MARIAPESSRELRRSVLRPGFGPDDPLPGDELSDAVHLGVSVDGRVVSTCFVFPDPCPWLPQAAAPWHLRQMATAPAHRGRGYAGLVVRAAARYARAQGADVLWCMAREPAVPMYLRAGLLAEGGIFTDEHHTIPHQRMWLALN